MRRYLFPLCRVALKPANQTKPTNHLQGPMETPSLKILDLNHYWNEANEIRTVWEPGFYHCGPYDEKHDWFPVLRSHSHIIYIPTLSKPILRFLQHAMYALFRMSHSERFSEYTRSNFLRGSKYLHLLREAFFKEVREKFYRSTDRSEIQETPACNKMTRQWFSSVLFSWAQVTYYNCRISPPAPTWLPPKPTDGQTLSTKFGKHLICSACSCYGQKHRLGRLVEVAGNRSDYSISIRCFAG
jgi:hypothetical protein